MKNQKKRRTTIFDDSIPRFRIPLLSRLRKRKLKHLSSKHPPSSHSSK